MGVGLRKLALLWALGLTLACAQHTGHARDSAAELGYAYPDLPPAPQGPGGNSLRGVTIHPPLRSTPLVRALNAAHRGRVCSTWGDFHYKTFDGDVFRFPGLCNYVFSAHCGAAYEDFNLQLRRGPGPNATAPSRVTMKLDGMVVELTKGSVLVNGRPIQLPFSRSGVLIEQRSSDVKVAARLGLVFMWNQDDSLLLELDAKYANQTCGLCGDFNGVPVFNEFFSHNIKLTATEFGNLQKMDGPTEQCQDPAPEPPMNCLTGLGICEEMLSSQPFSDCAALVDASSYLEACRQDLCHCDQANLTSCLCHTLAEYSRQCTHAGGLPLDWRGPQLCPQTCSLNMQYRECGSPCTDTCSNLEHSQLCEDHCIAGCFCPEGTVLDDISHTGCIPVPQCSCVYNGATYTPGTGYSTDCTNCTCSGGRWRCQEVQCPGTCSVLGGAHFSTFDERQYTVHGDCSYVLAKPCDSNAFTVLAELRRCGLTNSETCLKSLTLILGGGHMVSVVKASGEVFVNQIYTQLPLSAANVTLFRPSTFFIIAQTQLGLQLDIQLVPVMQVFVRLAPQLQGQTCGLCGNFNQNQADDFRTISGVVEGTAAAFANTWKTQAACPNIKNSLEDPCSLSVENEKYAQHWCSRLTDPHGPFTRCHAAVNPSTYYSNCMFDTCNCEKSEDCMCAALSSYVRACAARGVLLGGWRDGVCTKPMTTCPQSLTYLYNISTCQPTCRARSDADVTCSISFVPVDGCTCPDGTFLDDMGKCVPATSCPCYHGGSLVPDGESTHEQGVICTCTQGTLTCIGGHAPAPVCTPPMVYFDCRNTTPGAAGAGCQKSCHTLDMDCYSSQCVPGCVCPHGLVATGDGGCIPVSDCPCVHNEASYKPGQSIRVGCNTCTCKSRTWQCTDKPCPATCAVYGDGHYLTFDGQRYSFSGDCEYTLLQDHCGGNGSAQDSFRVITENVPCVTTGTTCSKAIKIFLGSYELKLSDGNVEVIEKERGQVPPFSIRQMGIYLVVDTDVSLVVLWDKRTSISLRLSPEFKGRVCGLCGNFDDNALNDFTTRSQSVVGDVLEFGNSWKFSPSCPDAQAPKDPCTANPYRKSWAQKQCSIINSVTFSACHAHVESARYYEACVSDACACHSGGDCECFCTAVAAYAHACHEVGVCVSWRTPDICPFFCDYYNPQGQCEWHYQPCGVPCLRTCRNPSGRYLHDVRGLEGCYPKCPSEAPIFDEDQMRCVASCPTPTFCHVQGRSYRLGSAVPSEKNCHYCVCTESGVQCTYDSEACVCTYDGRRFRPGEVIYHTTDGTGGCISARCGANGTIERRVEACGPTPRTPQTTFTFSTPLTVVSSTLPPGTHPSPSERTAHAPSSAPATTPGTSPGPTPPTASAPPSSRPRCGEACQWSPWLDVSRPGWGTDSGDFDTLENLRAYGHRVCRAPRAVECRAEGAPEVPLEVLGQRVQCSPTVGLTCYNRDQASGRCYNYQIRVLCCSPRACPTSSTETTPPATFSTTETGPTPGTSGVASVPTGRTGSSAPVTTPGPTTASTTNRTPGPGTSTTGKITLSTPSPAPVSTTTSVSTITPGPSKGTSSEPTQVTCLQESCTWTRWLDSSSPGAGMDGGDFDSFQNLRSKGYKFCANPKNVECRAEAFPNITLQTLGQNLICDKNVGLICWNKDQLPPICYNYQIRILCCEMVDVCTTKTRPPTTPGPTHTTTGETSTAWTTATFSSSTQHSAASSAYVPPKTRVTTRKTEQSPLGTTSCQPQCTWTKWFDADFPFSGPHGGDFETYSNIVRRGEKICHRPEYISALECRAENHPDVSIQMLGQVVQCSLEVGLVCRNRDQKGKFRMCLNYEVRVLCCEPQKGCPVTHATVPSTSSTTGPSTTPRTSTTNVETTSTTSAATTSTTTVETTSPTTAPTISTTTVETTGPTTAPRTSTTTVETTSPTTAPTISTTTVETTSTTSAATTSTTTVETTSTTTAPRTSTTTVETTSPTTAPTISTTTVETTSTTSAATTSTTTTASPTTAPATSTTTVGTTSRTSAPTTSTTFVTIPETTHSQPRTTSCQPQCLWTKWFDADFPSPEPQGGDFETYSNIIRRGEKICHRPEYISALECRAENHPDVSIQTLGQVVQCSLEVGLVCRNRDQKGRFRMCLNYEVRVLCCEPQKGCPVNSVTPFVTSSPQSSLSPKSTTPTVSLVTSPSSAAPSTSTCYCSVADRFYPAGSIIYQQTDLSGHCYYAVCSLDCHVVRRTDHTCPTSTPPPAPATSMPVSSSSASVTVTQGGCPNVVPPRTKGETWAMPNCSEATCEGNGVITVRPRQCPKAQKPTCTNGYPAVMVTSQEDCCPHYECPCVCSRWGEPHYVTFDGTYYTFLDNCTYVLVQQIVPVFGHFRVLIESYLCDAEDGLPCRQSIIVEYQKGRVVLTLKPVGGVMTNEITFNGEVVRPGFQKDGIVVSQIGTKMYVTIPALGVQVMFSGLIFSVELPFSKFANNTEGQCGTCTNDQKDECRLPGGAVVPSCSDMPGHWNVTYPGQPSCPRPPLMPTTVEPKKTPTSCPPSPICQLILSKVFKPCHLVIPPWPYYQSCTFDECHTPRVHMPCSSLELYATLCASLSVCIDWRGLTNHTCPFTCPADKVYQPCGPSIPSYCYTNDSASALALPEAVPVPMTEGCFCPEDMKLFSSSAEVCVPASCSSCLGPHGEPVEPGHTVSVDCQECTCKGGTWTLSCQTRPCAPPPACPEPGFVPVPAALQTGQCCPQYTCVCNTTYCPPPEDCPEGSRSILAYKEGACCPTQNCSWTVCSINGTLYQPGAIVSSNLCEKCWCELPGGPQSDTFVISCDTQICSTHCPVGFEYQTQRGQCCGECVQVACVMNTSDSSAHLFYPGESWSDPGSRCVTHECEKYQDGLVVVTTKKACPPLSCPADKARLSEDGCCPFCPQPQAQNRSTCAVYHELQVLRQPGCSSVVPVPLTYCRGNCGDTTSMYSPEARTMEHRCSCCRELRVSLRNVTLRCEDGSSQAFSYTEVEECGCVRLRCDSHGGLGHSGEVQGAERSREAGLRRKSRGAPASRPLQSSGPGCTVALTGLQPPAQDQPVWAGGGGGSSGCGSSLLAPAFSIT
ncbi:mucin-5AC [Mesoplodon densirostris]|uniref:mucin-5AC n=1 Tax=Mesoplodon densirostris TaxID=48708 RepID=UPI0028DC3777|nr:mucin-5AC [Mesoplodon densirostris]